MVMTVRQTGFRDVQKKLLTCPANGLASRVVWRMTPFSQPAEQDGWVGPVSEKESWTNAKSKDEEHILGTYVF